MNEKFLYILDEDEHPDFVNNVFVFGVIIFLLACAIALHVPGMP